MALVKKGLFLWLFMAIKFELSVVITFMAFYDCVRTLVVCKVRINALYETLFSHDKVGVRVNNACLKFVHICVSAQRKGPTVGILK